MIKTLTLNHYDQKFELKMSDGSKHEITIANRNCTGTDFNGEPYILENNPKYLLERWIDYGSVVDNINLSHVVNFTPRAPFNQREEQVTYKKHWFWGWRKDEN